MVKADYKLFFYAIDEVMLLLTPQKYNFPRNESVGLLAAI
jgi:hypothetical protein